MPILCLLQLSKSDKINDAAQGHFILCFHTQPKTYICSPWSWDSWNKYKLALFIKRALL